MNLHRKNWPGCAPSRSRPSPATVIETTPGASVTTQATRSRCRSASRTGTSHRYHNKAAPTAPYNAIQAALAQPVWKSAPVSHCPAPARMVVFVPPQRQDGRGASDDQGEQSPLGQRVVVVTATPGPPGDGVGRGGARVVVIGTLLSVVLVESWG